LVQSQTENIKQMITVAKSTKYPLSFIKSDLGL
jgi:hypothetical protein